jgi:hypothetical protein
MKNGLKLQGDQIGRLFTLGSFMKITKVAHIVGLLFQQ